MRSREAGWPSALAALLFFASGTSLGWVPGGETITGHVRGPGGVSVPGATVQLLEVQTGERKVTWTDEAGNYTLTGISPGTYRLEVSLLGFRTDVREPVPVVEGRALQVNLALVLTRPDDNASASAPKPAGSAGGPPNLESLPPEVREPRSASQQPPGADPALRLAERGERLNNPAQESAAGGNPPAEVENVRFSYSGASAGAQPEDSAATEEGDAASSAANSFLLSGSVSRAPSPGDEEGQRRQRGEEFRSDRESQSAPGFGGGGERFEGGGMFLGGGRWGGRPQVNHIRGNIVERYSNSAFDARPYPLNVPQSPRIPSYQEQAGIAVGGPLSIPHVYRGADRTSFFFHYNLQRSRNPFDSFATVPTPAERQGDFSSSLIPSGPLAGTVPVIYDPQSNPRTPFAQNRLTRFDPAALALVNYIPLPNLPGNVQNFHLQEALPSSNDRVMGRIGHRISGKDNVNIFYFLNSARSQSVGSFPGLTRNISVRSQNLNFGETHTFGPHTINNLALNFSRQRNSTLNPFAFQQDIERQLGIQGVSNDPRDWGLPLIGFTNFTGLNDAIPSLTRNQTLGLFDFLLLNRGKHNLRLGGEVRRVQLNTLTDPDARGTFTFSGFTTSDFTTQGFPVPGTGFDFADFLLGLPQATSVRFGTSSNYFRSRVYSGFAQDDWRVNARLTLNLGLRYEYFQPFTEKYGHLSDLAIGPGFSTVGVVTGLAPGPFPDSLLGADRHNVAPRLGLAVRPWTQRHWVFRAGYGIFYDDSVYQRLTANLANQPPFAEASTLLTTPLQVLTLEQGFPQIASNIARNTYAVDPNFRTPYGQTWSFSLEDEIARDLIFSAAYMGTKGTKLDLLLAPNSAPAGQQRLQNALQFQYETSGAASIYHALQVGLRRQFHNGFSMSGNYTFSKSIDDASSVGGAGNIVAQNFLDLQAERGLSVFDVRHRLSLNHTYEFPLGERKRYLNRGGALAGILGDWQISGNAQLQSGTPFTARALGNVSNNSGTGAYGSQRADSTGQTIGPASLGAVHLALLQYGSLHPTRPRTVWECGPQYHTRAADNRLQYVTGQVCNDFAGKGSAGDLPG